MAAGMSTYKVNINGIPHTLQYTDAEAERLGLDATVEDQETQELEAALAEQEAKRSAAAADAEAKAKAEADAQAKQAAPGNKAVKPETK